MSNTPYPKHSVKLFPVSLALALITLTACLVGLSRFQKLNPLSAYTNRETQVQVEPEGRDLRPTDCRAALLAPNESTRARVNEAYGNLPLSFEVNQGQMDSQVRFVARGAGYSLFLTSTEAVLALSKLVARSREEERSRTQRQEQAVVRIRMVGASPESRIEARDELPGRSNYFVGNDPAAWRTDIPSYAGVQYHEIYSGVDLVYYGNQRQLEYDFRLAPGADPETIRLGFEGVDRLEIDSRGDLIMHTASGQVRQHKPLIYQEVDGTRREVSGSYVLKGRREVGFAVGDYDATTSLVIDPVLEYSTCLGGGLDDQGVDIAVDTAGNAYVVGSAVSGAPGSANPPFPTTPGAFQTINNGGSEAFVTKMNATGTALIYSTYLGGNAFDGAGGIAIDTSGNAYIAGSTSSENFPTTPGAFQPRRSPGPIFNSEVFIIKLNPSGNGLVYSTYLGGASSQDDGLAIRIDADGDAYVTGSTNGGGFPTLNAAQPTYGGGIDDGFVARLNATGSALVYSTYLGGNSEDRGRGIALDTNGNAYVAGLTLSNNFPTVAAFQAINRGSFDAFLTKYSSTGSVQFSTYIGGESVDEGNNVAVDSAGNAYVIGYTQSFTFPVTSGAFQTTIARACESCVALDAFVAKFNPAGTALVYSTYLGGRLGNDVGRDIVLDSANNAYLTGSTNASNFPVTPDAFQPTARNGLEFFFTILNDTGSALRYSTFLGGSGSNDIGTGVALDPTGNAYITGYTNSRNFPVTPGAFQTSRPFNDFDAVVARFSALDNPPTDPIRVVLARDGSGQLIATVTITNPLADAVPGVQMTLVRASTLDGSAFVDGVPVPQSFGTVNPGQSVIAVVTFPGTAGVPSRFIGLVRVDLSYTGGTYTETDQVVTP